ncbi:MAG: hypothetical protein ACPGLV_05830 [Bacteroidia bacterium]
MAWLYFIVLINGCVSKNTLIKKYNAEQKKQCQIQDTTTYFVTKNDYFSIKLPKFWKLNNGVFSHGKGAISVRNADSTNRKYFHIWMGSFQKDYFKMVEGVQYISYNKQIRKHYSIVTFTRNDLYIDQMNNFYQKSPIMLDNKNQNEISHFWQKGLLIHEFNSGILYMIKYGAESVNNKEPDWCEFVEVLSSLKFKK